MAAAGEVLEPAAASLQPLAWLREVPAAEALEHSWDLASQPWLPFLSLPAQGQRPQRLQRSLLQAFEQAGELGPIDSGLPELDLAVLRFLGAFARRALPASDEARMRAWLGAGALLPEDLEDLRAYVSDVGRGLDLFGPRPFLQVLLDDALPGASQSWRQAASQLWPHRTDSFNTSPQALTWVDELPGNSQALGFHLLSPAEAALGLLQAGFSSIGGLVRAVFTSSPASPAINSWHVHPRGRTFLQQLAIQLLATPEVEGDVAPWEAAPLGSAAQLLELQRLAKDPDRRPRGPVDCCTWPSRTLRLLPQLAPDGSLVVAQVLRDGALRAIGGEMGTHDPNLLRVPGAPDPLPMAERSALKGTGQPGELPATAWVRPEPPMAWELGRLAVGFSSPVGRAVRMLEGAEGGGSAWPQGEVCGLAVGISSGNFKVLGVHAAALPDLRLPEQPWLKGEDRELAELELARAVDASVELTRRLPGLLASHLRQAYAQLGERAGKVNFPEADQLSRTLSELDGLAWSELVSGSRAPELDTLEAWRSWLSSWRASFADRARQLCWEAWQSAWERASASRLRMALVEREPDLGRQLAFLCAQMSGLQMSGQQGAEQTVDQMGADAPEEEV